MSNQVKQVLKQVLEELATSLETGRLEPAIKIGLTIDGSELGYDVMKEAAFQAKALGLFEVVLIGSETPWTKEFKHFSTDDCQKDRDALMEELLDKGEIQGCVTLHYNFPVGTATIGQVITPSHGKKMLIASTTGTTSSHRTEAMVLNTINGIIAAKTLGIEKPTVGILNVEGAKTVERALKTLKQNGYEIEFGQSQRQEGGVILRGNDLLMGSVDVAVCDSLTGNILMKLFSASTSGGNYETIGSGYGPGIGLNYDKNVCIISRASGTPVITNALVYAYQIAKGHLKEYRDSEYKQAKNAKLDEICEGLKTVPTETKEIKPPEKEIVTEEISGIDVMELEEAVKKLWQGEIYAESGMGCTGPVILINPKNMEKAQKILVEEAYLSPEETT